MREKKKKSPVRTVLSPVRTSRRAEELPEDLPEKKKKKKSPVMTEWRQGVSAGEEKKKESSEEKEGTESSELTTSSELTESEPRQSRSRSPRSRSRVWSRRGQASALRGRRYKEEVPRGGPLDPGGSPTGDRNRKEGTELETETKETVEDPVPAPPKPKRRVYGSLPQGHEAGVGYPAPHKKVEEAAAAEARLGAPQS